MKPSILNRFLVKQLLAAACFGGSAFAEDPIWDGGDSADWNVAGNWDLNNVPDSTTERAVFDGTGSNYNVTFGSNVAAFNGILMTASQSTALTINNSAVGQLNFRINSLAGLTIENGAGAFSLGTTGGNIQLVPDNFTPTCENNSGSTATLGSKIVQVTGGGNNPWTLTFAGSGDWQVDAALNSTPTSGASAIIKEGLGTTTLSAANTYAGSTTINAGTLKLTNSLAMQNSIYSGGAGSLVFDSSVVSNAFSIGSLNASTNLALTNNAAAAVALTIGNNTTAAIYSGGLSGTGSSLTKLGTGTQTLSGTNTYSGVTTINAGTLVFANEAALYNATPASWTAANLIVASGATAAFGVGGAGEFDATDIGNLIALTNLAAGVPATQGFKSGSRIGFDTTNAAGGVFTYANAITDHVAGATTDTLGLAKLGAGTLTLTGTNTYTGTTNIAAGTLEFSTAANQTLGGIISGAGALTKSGAGTLTLNAANTHTGGTTINGGTLAVGASGTVGGNINPISVGAGNSVILDLLGTAANKTITSGGITINTGSQLTINRSAFVDTGGQSATFTGALSGAGNLVIGSLSTAPTGAGHRHQFTSATAFDNFTGAITVQTGANLALFNGTLTSANSNNLTIDTGGFVSLIGSSTTFVGALTGGGTITKNGGSTAATLSVASGSFSGVISQTALAAGGTVALTKTSSETLTLSGASTYSGATTINAGTLLANNVGVTSATGTSTVTVKDTATLGGTGRVSGTVILESGATLAPGESIESLATGALTIPAGATLAAEIDSTAVTIDSVAVTGNLTLGGNLTVTDLDPAVITPGTKRTLMTYTGTLSVVSGAFSGKPEGSTFTVGSNTFKIRYADGGKNVTLEAVAAATGYAGWASTNAPSPQTAGQDYDNDGVSNGVEWVLGGLASTNDLADLPTLDTENGDFIFSFVRDQASTTGDTAVFIDVGTDLGTWTSYPVPDLGTLDEVEVVDNEDGTDTVTLTLTQTPDPKKFARLNVVITP